MLVEPITSNIARWQAPWTELVRVRSSEWRQYLSNDRAPHARSRCARSRTQRGINQLRATVLLKG